MSRAGVHHDRFRGSRLHLPAAMFYPHDAAPIDAAPYLVSARTSKHIAQPAGSFTLSLKERPLALHGKPMRSIDWRAEVADDDWVVVQADGAGGRTALLLGLVDAVTRTRAGGQGGAETVTYRVRGRCFGKIFTDTESLSMPTAPYDFAVAAGMFYDAVSILAALLRSGTTPGAVVKILVSYLLRGGAQRHATRRFWSVPDALPFPSLTGMPGVGRQFTDILSTAEVDEDTEGELVVWELLGAVAGGQGGRLYDILDDFANRPFNEMFCDLRPQPRDRSFAAAEDELVVVVRRGGPDAVPALVLREQPFPAVPTTTPDRAPDQTPTSHWDALRTHDVSELDVVDETIGRNGRERANFFMAQYAASLGFDRYTMAFAEAAAGGLGLDSVPAVDIDSVERHGWRRYEVTSRYLVPDDTNLLTLRRWTHLLRDWYANNHRFLSGSIRLAHARPEIRIGERLRIHRRDGTTELYYVEGVDHDLRVGHDGKPQASTSLTLTRGTVGGETLLPDPRAAVQPGTPAFGNVNAGGVLT